MSEYKPTEYIVDFGDCRSKQFVRLSMALIEQNGAKLGELIVRCRDCAYYTEDDMEYYHYCGSWCEQVEPDGFCKWGERREK